MTDEIYYETIDFEKAIAKQRKKIAELMSQLARYEKENTKLRMENAILTEKLKSNMELTDFLLALLSKQEQIINKLIIDNMVFRYNLARETTLRLINESQFSHASDAIDDLIRRYYQERKSVILPPEIAKKEAMIDMQSIREMLLGGMERLAEQLERIGTIKAREEERRAKKK